MLPGVASHTVDTDRLRMHYLEAGPEDGIQVVLVHGNLSTGRFFEHVMSGAPDRLRLIAPDMRGFGDTEFAPIDATHGLRDWSDDTYALVRALGIERPVHLAGWSRGGAAVAAYAVEHAPVASRRWSIPSRRTGTEASRPTGRPAFPTTPALPGRYCD